MIISSPLMLLKIGPKIVKVMLENNSTLNKINPDCRGIGENFVKLYYELKP